MKHGKKYAEAAKLVDRSTLYDTADAIAMVKKTATAKFDETVEVHIKTGCDGRHAEQQVRGAVVLPNGTGKTVKVLVFAKGDKIAEAEAAGADHVGGDELIPRIQNDGTYNSCDILGPSSSIVFLRSAVEKRFNRYTITDV